MSNRIGILGRQIDLYVRFCDAAGNPVNTDDTPQVEITDFDGTVKRSLNKRGVCLACDPGVYLLSYTLPINASDGYWSDRWVAKIGGTEVEQVFEFQVLAGGNAKQDKEPEPYPGDDFEFTFSKEEVKCINKLLAILRKRLKSSGTVRVPDGNGGFMLKDCPIFSDDELICFLINSLSEFNQMPHFTDFTFAHPQICGIFSDIIIQGAMLLALAAQSLIERGREFTINDNGIQYQPPTVSEILNSQYTTQLSNYMEKLKFIKNNLKPSPLGLGTYRVTAINPNFLRLRHLRARQII